MSGVGEVHDYITATGTGCSRTQPCNLGISFWQPTSGPPGTKLYVYLRHNYDPALLRRHFFHISFRNMWAVATLMTIDHSSPYYQHVLSAIVPEFYEHPHEPVPLGFYMQDGVGNHTVWLEFGSFVYMSNAPTLGELSHSSSLTNRPSIQRLYGKSTEMSTTYALPPTQEEFVFLGGSCTANLYEISPLKQSGAVQRAKNPVENKMIMPHMEYNQPYSSKTVPTTSNRSFPVSGVLRAKTTTPSSSSSETPQLIRTSTMQPHPKPPSTVGSQPISPETVYPHKAVLNIQGDLGAMVENWSEIEWENGRRLVQFERSQISNTIMTSFKPVTLGREPNSVCISCIWWEEKGECFVTSVDIIYLLESLVAGLFTVEEKYRVRRNLECFGPLTVSEPKSKDDSRFFNVIMAFPDPKPRNVKKNVKVFPWKILNQVLEGIISKYSLNYSSTATPSLPSIGSDASTALSSGSGIEVQDMQPGRTATNQSTYTFQYFPPYDSEQRQV